ncbi:MAG: GGDEF domain-containing protein [Rhodobacterales bacterium]|nr:GGDEF domain-containing protein [Rhodobacterales bacterium]
MTALPCAPVDLSAEAAALLMPLHLRVDAAGLICGAGPTFGRLVEPDPVLGRPLFDVVEIRRPGGVADLPALAAQAGQRLHLALRRDPQVPLRGLAVPLSCGGFLLNLGFGLGLVEAVRRHALTDRDFAVTDLAVELLYLVEAKTAVVAELADLNRRLREAKTAAEEQALTDTLTGVRNLRALGLVFDRLVAEGRAFGLIRVDLDYFKQVNDTLGHAAGDRVLRHVAEALRASTRGGDTVARVGGDEFVILCPDLTDAGRLMTVARRILARLSQGVDYEGQPCRISASLGLALSVDHDRATMERMLADADAALYAAKHAGRGRVALAHPDRAADAGLDVTVEGTGTAG